MNELELLTALRDAGAEPPDPAARADARRALLEQAAGRPARPARRRRWLFATAGSAAAAGLAVALLTGIEGGRVAPPPARAALERAAHVAGARPGLDLAPGEFLYLRERDAYSSTSASADGGWSSLTPSTRETWIGRDGAGRFVDRGAGKPTFFGPRDRARWEAAGRPDQSGGSGASAPGRFHNHGFTAGSTTLSYRQLASLPTDGKAMYDRLLELAGDAGPSPDAEAFVIIGDLLRSAPVPAKVRAALYRSAGYIEGVRYAGEVTDPLGRRGLAIELPNPEARNRLVFDPDTSELLAEETVLTKRVPYMDADPGAVVGSRVVLRAAVVGSDTERPAR
jgi:hypothetical protein